MNSFLLKGIVAVCGLTWLGLLVLAGTVQISAALWVPFGAVVTMAGAIVWLFDKWLWAYRPFSWLTRRADLRGTWHGKLVSDWVNPETEAKVAPITAYMSVTQTASVLYLRQFSEESSSSTVAASLVRDADDAEAVVVVYRNDPKGDVRHRSPIHFGGMRLTVAGDGRLAGEYWTDRSTRGQLTLERVSGKRSRSLPEAKEAGRRLAGRQLTSRSSTRAAE